MDVLKEKGFSNLSEANQREFLPQFVAEAQVRIGLAVMPLLDKSATDEMSKMMREQHTAAEWWNFWSANVPNFKDVLRDAIVGFVADMRK